MLVVILEQILLYQCSSVALSYVPTSIKIKILLLPAAKQQTNVDATTWLLF